VKILLVHPGASMSTADVYNGLLAGLRLRGHEIYEYALDARIERAGAWLTYNWRKNGKRADQQPHAQDILYKAGEELVARSLRLLPDVVFVVSAMYLHPDVLLLLRRAGLKVVILFTESPYDDEKQKTLIPLVDYAWTNEQSSAREMRIGYLRHAWAPEVHAVDAPLAPGTDVPSHDVVFVGTGFAERLETLSAVDWSGVDLGLYGSWDLMGSRSHLRKFLRGSYVENAFAAALYRRAKIGLNLYRSSIGFGKEAPRVGYAESLNPRAYELAATGCFTVSDYRPEVTDTFGSLVPTFSQPDEVRPLLDRWLADDAGRAAVKQQLPGAVAGHTWHERAAQIESDLQASGIVASLAAHADAI
jgi:spore maturation protein CgeB